LFVLLSGNESGVMALDEIRPAGSIVNLSLSRLRFQISRIF